MKIVIVDDDTSFAKNLEGYVKTLCKNHEIPFFVERIENPLEILDKRVIFDYDVVLLDIEMPVMSGFDVAKRLNSIKCNRVAPYIIFVTSQDHLVFEALNYFPHSFVRKSSLEDLDLCLQYIHRMLAPTYVVKSGKSTITIRLNELVHVEKQGNYVKFITVDNIYQERTNIDTVFKAIGRHGFLKVHSGSLINAAHITEVSNDCVKLSDEKRIPISRAYKKSFKEQFSDWMVKQ